MQNESHTLPRSTTASRAPEVSIVVPTRNERDNVAPLFEQLRRALSARHLSAELIFVDDSDDGTDDAARALGGVAELKVKVLHRAPGARTHGLAGAVLHGFRQALGDFVVVMDGDLQHPPDIVPVLVAEARTGGEDLVVASRRVEHGETAGLGSVRRRLASGGATLVSRSFFPLALRGVTDPMSGFFLVRRAAVDVSRVESDGFKILLSLLVSHPRLRRSEVAYHFGPRLAGKSKAGLYEGLRYLRLLVTLREAGLGLGPARRNALSRILRFGVVGLSGLAVNTLALWSLTQPVVHLGYLPAAALATQASTAWNWLLTEKWVFRGDKPGRVGWRLLKFAATNNITLVARLPLLSLLVTTVKLHYLVANLVTLVALFLARYAVSDRHIYRAQPATSAVVAPELLAGIPKPRKEPITRRIEESGPVEATVASRGTGYLAHRYEIPGVATIGSAVALPELHFFRRPDLGRDLDIEIRIGRTGSRPHRRAALSTSLNGDRIRYSEHLGRLSANFLVDIGEERITVTCSPLLARSPHVLYTNVLEALLRFQAVRRGRMLLHSACLDLGGAGIMLSARTDTGKTGTILRLTREHPALFLSDDMTIVGPEGAAQCFPKPLTISHHTLRAVDPGDLSAWDWWKLRIKSRLHSKEGRQWGMLLARLNLPIMTMNALVQMAVPPPKYHIDRLVDVATARQVRVTELFIIERGDHRLEDVGAQTALQELLDNTDDAYGFPPFEYFAPSLVLGGDDYARLREKEREILAAFLGTVTVRRMATDDFSWADRIPELVSGRAPATAPSPQETRGQAAVPPGQSVGLSMT